MPVRPPRVCRCGAVVQPGILCPRCHRANKRARDQRADAKRGTAAQRGYGHKWRTEREKYLAGHLYCVMCLQDGRQVPATVVDHIIPHKGDKKLFWRRSNWQALCQSCHNGRKQREESNQ